MGRGATTTGSGGSSLVWQTRYAHVSCMTACSGWLGTTSSGCSLVSTSVANRCGQVPVLAHVIVWYVTGDGFSFSLQHHSVWRWTLFLSHSSALGLGPERERTLTTLAILIGRPTTQPQTDQITITNSVTGQFADQYTIHTSTHNKSSLSRNYEAMFGSLFADPVLRLLVKDRHHPLKRDDCFDLPFVRATTGPESSSSLHNAQQSNDSNTTQPGLLDRSTTDK